MTITIKIKQMRIFKKMFEQNRLKSLHVIALYMNGKILL